MIKAIIFDWGDTLAPGTTESYFPVKKVKKEFKLSDKTIKQCLEMLNDFEPHHSPHTIEQERKILTDFWKPVLREIRVKNADLLANYLLDWSFEKFIPKLFPNVLDTIRYLFEKRYELAILTNGWPTRFLGIKRSKIGKYFKTILVSSLIGARKPDVKAYQIALKEIGIPANQILMVDNKDHFLVPAHKLGMQVLYLDKIDFNPNSEFPRIKDISEVIDYLEKNGQ